jgi:hypothetical protein
LSPGPKTDFDGLIDLSSGDVGDTAAWIACIEPDYAVNNQDLPVQTASAKGHLVLGAGGFEATGLSLRLDRSALTGTVAFQPAQGSQAALLKANLRSDALDIDALPGFDRARFARNLDLNLHLDARAIKVASLGGVPADAGHIQIGLVRSGPRLALDPFKIEGLGGAAIAATAHFDSAGGKIDAKLDADKLNGATDLLKPVPAGGLALSSASFSGTLGASRAEAELSPDPANPDNVTGRAMFSAREGSGLLRQIGVPALPLDNIGTSQVTLT